MAYQTTPCPCCGYVAATPSTPSPPPSEPPSMKHRFSLRKTKKRVLFTDLIATFLGPVDAFRPPAIHHWHSGRQRTGFGAENRGFLLGGSDGGGSQQEHSVVCYVSCFKNSNVSTTSSSLITSCLPEQTTALFQHKVEFALIKPNFNFYYLKCPCSADPYYNAVVYGSYPKMKFWKKETDCCSWDRVRCNTETGKVVGLGLANSWLQGLCIQTAASSSCMDYEG
ncbi:hypothetical protein FNV43_RR00206 [Rhamnella rubrinervis]|uniref:Uncharacterized protein n=1 Tax=Rhamnella rubrinervis TaxID=2594499 RepID=A0A8K0MRS8_9ROSA|nr:hypothetical protein FNV43_RR00206 [Rhamnella rubrinervis]